MPKSRKLKSMDLEAADESTETATETEKSNAKAKAKPADEEAAAGKKSEDEAKEYQLSGTYEIGDLVYHKLWNDKGKVTEKSVTEDGYKYIVVEFEKIGTKKLITEFEKR